MCWFCVIRLHLQGSVYLEVQKRRPTIQVYSDQHLYELQLSEGSGSSWVSPEEAVDTFMGKIIQPNVAARRKYVLKLIRKWHKIKMMKNWAVFLILIGWLGLCTACGQMQREASPSALAQADVPQQVTPTESESLPEEETPDPYEGQRLRMVEETIVARGVSDEDVLRAMRTVPRHLFVLEEYLSQAYADHPLPIGYGQTISQPYIVAWMTELLELKPGDKVLEIGTGSGYQAAVLAELGYVDVYSIEIIPQLAERAARTLEAAGYTGIHLKQGDGYYGWEEFAPYNAIIVTAAPDHLPPPLVEQLTEDGRIVIPIGPPGGYQTLWRFVIEADGLKGYNLGGVAFVPFTRAEPETQPAP